jgi:uncharacterized protein affecting Mg2+/Co2+ transport
MSISVKSFLKLSLFILFLLAVIKSTDAQTSQVTVADNSSFVTESVPSAMNPDQSYKVIVTFKNTGTTTWMPSGTAAQYSYKLAVIDNGDKMFPTGVWGVVESQVTKSIEPGETVSFELNVKAPSAPGTYSFEWSMMHADIYFGEHSKPVMVNVGGNSGSVTNSSAFVEQRVSEVMSNGNSYDIKITMTNSGSSTWTSGLYKLVYLDPRMNPTTNNVWGLTAVSLKENISPGSTYDFNFTVTAPVQPGMYPFQWGMMSGDGQVFGDASKHLSINVVGTTTIKEGDNDAYKKKNEKMRSADEHEKARDNNEK